MTAPIATFRRTFSSLRVRNYRLYFVGQTVSVSGTWMQRVAQSWLVLELTGSGTAIGLVTALQFLPMLFLAPFGGVIADRFAKRRMLYLTQTLAAALAGILGLLVLTDLIQLWMVYVLAGALGLVASIDNPVRQTFIVEMVGTGELTNAVSLYSVLVNLARVLGPAAAGLLIVTVGLAACFLINAASYLAVLLALALMRADELEPAPPQRREPGQLLEGIRYARSNPIVLTPLLMMALIGTFAYEYSVILPLFARFTFGGDAGTFGAMTAAMGGGAVLGGLVAASRHNRPPSALAGAAAAFGVLQLVAALAPGLGVAFLALAALGATSIVFSSLAKATVQIASAPQMRGRMMGLYAVAFLGSTPIGGPIVGWIGEHIGPRYGLGVGGVACLMAAGLAMRRLRSAEVLEGHGEREAPGQLARQPSAASPPD